jgi:hypothetical protein
MTGQDTLPQGVDRDAGRRSRGLKFFPALCAVILVGLTVYASQRLGQPAPAQGRPAAQPAVQEKEARASKAVAAAKNFLDKLDKAGRDNALLDFDSKKKAAWSNLPVSMVKRNGVRMGDLTPAQRDAVLDLLKAVLSKEGAQKAVDIMNADQTLVTGKGGKKAIPFGNDEYYLAIFGTPSETKPWMLQFGGHHLGINVTVVGNASVLTPTHTGTQPDAFERAGKTVRPLGGENDKAFKLIGALDDKQRAQAVLGPKPLNLILGPGNDGKKIDPKGVKASTFTAEQKTMLLDLIGEWVHILPSAAAADRMKELKAQIDDTYFAWSGPTKPGSAAYFRVQGPTVVIEYAPQGSTSHIHTVIRDPTNDYGEKLLAR